VRDFLGKTVVLAGTVVTAGRATGVIATLQGDPSVTLRAPHPLTWDVFAGARCQLAIRPERLSVHTAPETDHPPNALPARIETLFFLGDCYEARLRLPGDQTVQVRLARTSDWQEGQRIILVVPEGAVSVWPG
jgi:ABC-type Fe3+/spermidine/putrescine transport system ATPase subunit